MRDQETSPFLPGSGLVPELWAGRAAELADARAAARRRLAGVHDRGRAVLGEFGIGKSVLVNRVAEDLRADGHWVLDAVRVPVDGDPVALLAEALLDLAAARSLAEALGRAAGEVLGRVSAITVPVVGGGVTLRARGERDYRDVQRLLEHTARLARAQQRLLLVRVDEVQNVPRVALSQLLTLLGDALEATVTETDVAGVSRRLQLPLLVYLSGLPDFRDRVGQAGATFARRFKTFELDYLDEAELREALIPFTTTGWPLLTDAGPATVHMAPEAADLVVTSCLGDPFLFQLVGEAAWNAGEGAIITAEDAQRGWRLVRREVVRYVEGRLGELSELQLAYLRAAAALPEDGRTAVAIAGQLGRDGAHTLASTAQSLDRTHRLIRREAGRIRFRSNAVRAFLAGGWP